MEVVTGLALGLWLGLLAGLLLVLAVLKLRGRSSSFRGSGAGATRAVPHLPEAQAQRQLVEQALQAGADDVLARNPGMTRKEARRIAAELWEKAGDPLGGVQ